MTLHQLHIFIVAATTLNLRLASEQLRIAQPAISHQLRLLQEEFQLKLHKKIGTGIALTQAGQLFLREAKAIVSRVENLRATLARTAGMQPVGFLNVGGSYSPSAVLLPSVLARFKETHPHLTLTLRTHRRSAMERLILSGEVEVAVLHNPPSNRSLTMEPYKNAPLAAFVASGHPLARKRHLAAKDFQEVGFIIRKPAADVRTGKHYLEMLQKLGFTINVVMRCDSLDAVKMAVRQKMGVGILYQDVIVDDVKKGDFKVLSLPADTSGGKSFIVYHKTRPLSALAVEFVKLLRTYRDKC